MSSVEGLGARSRHAVKQPTLAEGTSKTIFVQGAVYMVIRGVSASTSVNGVQCVAGTITPQNLSLIHI